ncbi:E3 ubiquitin-protein ligase SIAH1 [Sigmodon hispidus]
MRGRTGSPHEPAHGRGAGLLGWCALEGGPGALDGAGVHGALSTHRNEPSDCYSITHWHLKVPTIPEVLEEQAKYDGHQQFFAIVQLIGTRKQAENFAYQLELNGHRRRLTWEATPRSIHEGIATAIMNSDCLVFDTSIAQLFAENGNLGINVTISMC